MNFDQPVLMFVCFKCRGCSKCHRPYVGFNNKTIQVAASQHHFQSVILFSSYFNRAVKVVVVCAKGKNSCCYLNF